MAQQGNNDPNRLVDIAMRLAREDAAVTHEMRQAILEGRLRDALLCACKLAGIEPTPAIDRLEDPQKFR